MFLLPCQYKLCLLLGCCTLQTTVLLGRYWCQGRFGRWRVFLMLQLNTVSMCLLDGAFKTNFHGVLLGLARSLKSSSLKWGVWSSGVQWPQFPLLCCTSNTSVQGAAARGYWGARHSSYLFSRGSEHPNSGISVPMECKYLFLLPFHFSVHRHSEVAEHIHHPWLFNCLSPGNAAADGGISPTTKASSEILFVCLEPKHKLPLWRMGCLMEVLLQCHGVLITFLMCQIPSDFKPHCRLCLAPLWPGLETEIIYSCFTL